MTPDAITTAFVAACRAELNALKPGNVHRFRAGHGMEIAHFEAAAQAAAPLIAAPGASIGMRVETAVRASFAATGLNTNLGILLLCAPLAAAAERAGPLRPALIEILAGLTLEDADAVYRAIVLASPGGLGQADEHDVNDPARVTLLKAMQAAAHRDLIAAQYANGFADIFALGFSRLAAVPANAATEAVYMGFLESFPDSHIARKFGETVAETVRREAAEVAAAIDWNAPDETRRQPLDAFDRALKARGLNPGTSADLTVATLFAATLES